MILPYTTIFNRYRLYIWPCVYVCVFSCTILSYCKALSPSGWVTALSLFHERKNKITEFRSCVSPHVRGFFHCQSFSTWLHDSIITSNYFTCICIYFSHWITHVEHICWNAWCYILDLVMSTHCNKNSLAHWEGLSLQKFFFSLCLEYSKCLMWYLSMDCKQNLSLIVCYNWLNQYWLIIRLNCHFASLHSFININIWITEQQDVGCDSEVWGQASIIAHVPGVFLGFLYP